MLDTVKEMAHKHFQGARGSHNWDHTLRACRFYGGILQTVY